MTAPTAPHEQHQPPAPSDGGPAVGGRVARVLLLVQALLVGLLTLAMLAWAVFEEPHDPPMPVGRDLTLAEAAAVAALLAWAALTIVARRRLRRGRPRAALALAGLTLVVAAPSLLQGPELAWWVAIQVAILVSAWRSRPPSVSPEVGP